MAVFSVPKPFVFEVAEDKTEAFLEAFKESGVEKALARAEKHRLHAKESKIKTEEKKED
ncbi:MAG: hypothetical protein IJ192_07940 [Clostridia bacterium]|nr:hypothetical protein [Clostridia bacterium]